MILILGIGGRFDSTNFFDHPVACVITSISLDHQALLGNTLEEIAWQKVRSLVVLFAFSTYLINCPQ